MLGVLALAGCGSAPDESLRGTPGFVQGFFGGVAADEPRAVQDARDILTAGGNAIDAAVALYFTLSVTLPSSAGLGGGGTCVVYDHRSNRTEALDFLARPTATVPPSADRPSAIPGNPRGFFILHNRYGQLRWDEVVKPAEQRARFGIQVSRAFDRDLADRDLAGALATEPGTLRLLTAEGGGGMVKEGDSLRQAELAGMLGRLRSQGPGDLYIGQTARTLVAATAAAGGSLSLDDLRTYAPLWRDTVRLPYGNDIAHFAPPPAAAGAVAATMWAQLAEGGRYAKNDPALRAHAVAEAAMRSYADRGQWMTADGSSRVSSAELVAPARIGQLLAGWRDDRHTPAAELNPAPVDRQEMLKGATSFVTVDRSGSAVACSVTMNHLFGTGRVAAGTGMLIAARPDEDGRGSVSLGPMLVVNENSKVFRFAGAASGGVTAPTALVQVALSAMAGGMPLDTALAAPRVHHSGVPDLLVYERGMDRAVLDGLLARGYSIGFARDPLGLVNAIHCPLGLPSKPESCAVANDPRGAGLAVSADR